MKGQFACFTFSALLIAFLPSIALAQTGSRHSGAGSILHAVRVSEPIRIDGVLDEAVWQQATPISGFRQRWPADGTPASERTEVRVVYDDGAIYCG